MDNMDLNDLSLELKNGLEEETAPKEVEVPEETITIDETTESISIDSKPDDKPDPKPDDKPDPKPDDDKIVDGVLTITYAPCEYAKCTTITDNDLANQGKILNVTVKLIKVCPNKKVAIGVEVTELDAWNNEYPRGFRTLVTEHHQATCTDMYVPVPKFILPAELAKPHYPVTPCGFVRKFKVRVYAHYVDISCPT